MVIIITADWVCISNNCQRKKAKAREIQRERINDRELDNQVGGTLSNHASLGLLKQKPFKRWYQKIDLRGSLRTAHIWNAFQIRHVIIFQNFSSHLSKISSNIVIHMFNLTIYSMKLHSETYQHISTLDLNDRPSKNIRKNKKMMVEGVEKNL